jgi:hypothetical protein
MGVYALALLGAFGCSDAGSVPRADGGVRDAGGDEEVDGSQEVDGGGGEGEGGVAQTCDTGDCDAGPGLPECSPACGADQYCLPSGTCAARCSEDCGEPGPRIDPSNGALAGPLASDGARLLYFQRSWRHTDLSSDPSEQLYRWDLRGAPQALDTRRYVQTYALKFQDGWLYQRSGHPDFDAELTRWSPDTPGDQYKFTDGAAIFWLTAHTIWWTGQNVSLAEALWRADTSAADLVPELVGESTTLPQERYWITGNSTAVYTWDTYRSCRVLTASLNDPFAKRLLMPCSGRPNVFFVDDDSLYITSGADYPSEQPVGTELRRVKLDGSLDEIALAPPELATRNVFVSGDWVYWGAQLDAVTGSINRSHRDMALPSEELLRGDLDPELFTVIDDKLVWSRRDRFFVKPLRPLPCSDAVACPGGGACSSTGRCE